MIIPYLQKKARNPAHLPGMLSVFSLPNPACRDTRQQIPTPFFSSLTTAGAAYKLKEKGGFL
jgi:hypothetical protein